MIKQDIKNRSALARLLKCSPSKIHKIFWEQYEHPNPVDLNRICRALGVKTKQNKSRLFQGFKE